MGVGTWLPLWVAMSALASLPGPLIDGSNQAIWQSKVPPDLQGRVFSARLLIAWITNPISPLIAGLMGDYVLEPAMRVPSGHPPPCSAGSSLLDPVQVWDCWSFSVALAELLPVWLAISVRIPATPKPSFRITINCRKQKRYNL